MTGGTLWIGVLASHICTRTSPPHYGDEDAQMEPRTHSIGSCHEERCPESNWCGPHFGQDAWSKAGMVRQSEELSVTKTAMRIKPEEAVDGSNKWKHEDGQRLPGPNQMEKNNAGTMLGRRDKDLLKGNEWRYSFMTSASTHLVHYIVTRWLW